MTVSRIEVLRTFQCYPLIFSNAKTGVVPVPCLTKCLTKNRQAQKRRSRH